MKMFDDSILALAGDTSININILHFFVSESKETTWQ